MTCPSLNVILRYLLEARILPEDTAALVSDFPYLGLPCAPTTGAHSSSTVRVFQYASTSQLLTFYPRIVNCIGLL